METYGQQITSYLSAILDQTKTGLISWQRTNPTVFLATVASANARISLQKINRGVVPPPSSFGGAFRPVPGPAYIFNVTDLGTGETVLSINERDPVTTQILTDLYTIIEDVSKKKGAEILRRIVEG